jgi:hypothetical protein
MEATDCHPASARPRQRGDRALFWRAKMKVQATRPDPGQVKRSLRAAIDYLDLSQLPNGEFRTYASADPAMGDGCRLDSSPFVTSLVVYSIGFSGSSKVRAMTARALDFLQREMEAPGLWRYWSSLNERYRWLPPDLDDTCCISFVLAKNGRPQPPNREALLANRNGQGVFYTWLLPRSKSGSRPQVDLDSVDEPESLLLLSVYGGLDDVDCVANANALLYLGESRDTEGALEYLLDVVQNEREDSCSRFYLHRLLLYYALSRAYSEGIRALEEVRGLVTERVVQAQSPDGSFGSGLLTAAAVCTLLNFGLPTPSIHQAVRSLIEAQQPDGSWLRVPVFLGPAPYYGSEDLSTALCVEALVKYSAGDPTHRG